MTAPCYVQRRRRRGFTVVEIAVSALILAIAMTTTVRVLGWIAAERRAVERRQCAIHEVANTMERLAARPWERLSAGTIKDLTLSPSAKDRLPAAELQVTVEDQGAAGKSKRLAVVLRWRNRVGMWDAPARLAAWASRGRDDR